MGRIIGVLISIFRADFTATGDKSIACRPLLP